jgi:poly(3-hydroxybutyrate) depolymerase
MFMAHPVTRLFGALVLCVFAAPASAELVEKTGRFGGLQVAYKVVLPPGYDAARSYPVVLVFTGGAQQLRGAENTLNTDWRSEAEKRGYVVISPGTPDGSLFFEGADRIFPEFLDAIVRDYKPQGGKLHVAGHSNGGLSAFHVAAKFPSYFISVTGYPGLLQGATEGNVRVLKSHCLYMHVGDRDTSWMSAMERQADSLRRQGFRIRFSVEKGQEHRLRAPEIDLSRRLFEEIESCK